MIMLRLLKLIDTKCDRLALNFCQKALQAIRASSGTEALRTSVTEGNYQKLQQTYLSLLVKFKQGDVLKATLKAMDYDTATDFLRYSRDAEITERASLINSEQSNAVPITSTSTTAVPKKPSEYRLLKYLSKVNKIALNSYLIQLFEMETFVEDKHRDLMTHYLAIWIREHRSENNFHALFKNLVNRATSSARIFIACDILCIEVRKIIKYSFELAFNTNSIRVWIFVPVFQGIRTAP